MILRLPCIAWLRLRAGVAALAAAAALQAGSAGPRSVLNAGRGGDTSGDLLVRAESDVLAQAPDLVVLLAGTNDCLNSQKGVPLARYEENLRRLVRELGSQGARVLLVTIPPAHAPYLLARHPREFYGREGPAARVVATNEVVHRVAREQGLPVVEFHAALQKAGGASGAPDSLIRNVANSGAADGVHPTAAGYRLLARLVAEVIARERLQDCRKIVCFGDSITRGVHMPGEGTATGDTYPAFLLRALNEAETGKGSSNK